MPRYSYGYVYESESRVALEFDDTPDKERILLYYHSGTETEITDKVQPIRLLKIV